MDTKAASEDKGGFMTTDVRSNCEGDDRVHVKQAIAAYAQSEKVKSGLIWISQIAEQVAVIEGPGRQPAMGLLKTLAHMIVDEADLAARVTRDKSWHEIREKIHMALVMINSGVPQETGFHLTQAISQVTRIGGQAAMLLKERGLF